MSHDHIVGQIGKSTVPHWVLIIPIVRIIIIILFILIIYSLSIIQIISFIFNILIIPSI